MISYDEMLAAAKRNPGYTPTTIDLLIEQNDRLRAEVLWLRERYDKALDEIAHYKSVFSCYLEDER